MKIEKIVKLPISGSGCGSVKLTSLGVMLLIEFEYHQEGRDRIGSINFEGVTAYRFRDELHSLGYFKGSYDSLVEIQDSDWIKELLHIEPKGFRGVGGKRHYALFLSSNGLFEIIADMHELLLEREGKIRG